MASDVVSHESGRPWLVGSFERDQLLLAEGGPSSARVRLAAIGRSSMSVADLESLAPKWLDHPELGRFAGSFHLLASSGARIVCRGTASGVRRMFYASINGYPVAADRPSVLGRLLRAGPDPAKVAASLLEPSTPYPLDVSSLWDGVVAVRPDHYLRIESGSATTTRWWSAPEPVEGLAEGSRRVRHALTEAVELRVRAGGRITADLSGGMDSTSLCMLVSRQNVGPATESRADIELTTLRVTSIDPAGDDAPWAQRAAALLPRATHLVLDNESPLETGSLEKGASLSAQADGPIAGLLTRNLMGRLGRSVAECESRLHLSGYGGDEVFMVSRAYLPGLLRRNPVEGWRHLRAHAGLRRWTLPSAMREVARNRDYDRWRTKQAAELQALPIADGLPQFGWAPAVRLPEWATPTAAGLLRETLLATEDRPLAEDPSQHRAVFTIWSIAHTVRQIGQLIPRLETPFLDDNVIDASLSVDLAVRGNPWRYKQLLVEAIRPLVPPDMLERRTKASFTADGMRNMRRLRDSIIALCDNAMLARCGLVDAQKLRDACVALDPWGRTLMKLESTAAAELWMREVSGEPSIA